MTILLAYICVAHGPKTAEYAARFVGSYLANPPGVEHQTVVVCNGGMLDPETAMLFLPMDVKFFVRENDGGWDVSGFIDVAKNFQSDMQVNFGESCYLHKPGWMLQLAQAWSVFGPSFLGVFSSHSVRAHLNTNAFACSPNHLREYPPVTNHPERYAFEHGPNALWRRLDRKGIPVRLVTWDGTWRKGDWRKPQNILSRGTQENCLCWCIHNERYWAADPATKRLWASYADRPFS